jgi:hypothetical protein
MRIACTGCQAVGKSTFIKDFLQFWPNYTTPKKSYRDLVKKKGLKINKEGTKESQMAILNYHLDEIQRYSRDDNVILDRCVIDPLVFTFWLYEKETGSVNEDDIHLMLKLVQQGLKLYDIIFWFPLDEGIKIPKVKGHLRIDDEEFREEVNNIFTAVNKSYLEQTKVIFPSEDCPALIDLHGSREERIAMARMYITPEGKPYGEDTPSLIHMP